MPGVPLLGPMSVLPGGPAAGGGPGAGEAPHVARSSRAAFIAWVIVIGIVIPTVILGSLHAGKFRFVFRAKG